MADKKVTPKKQFFASYVEKTSPFTVYPDLEDYIDDSGAENGDTVFVFEFVGKKKLLYPSATLV